MNRNIFTCPVQTSPFWHAAPLPGSLGGFLISSTYLTIVCLFRRNWLQTEPITGSCQATPITVAGDYSTMVVGMWSIGKESHRWLTTSEFAIYVSMNHSSVWRKVEVFFAYLVNSSIVLRPANQIRSILESWVIWKFYLTQKYCVANLNILLLFSIVTFTIKINGSDLSICHSWPQISTFSCHLCKVHRRKIIGQTSFCKCDYIQWSLWKFRLTN